MWKVSNLGRTGWMVIGAIGALVLVPSAAVATATGLTGIVGSSGQQAADTDAGQLATAEAAPGSFEILFNANSTTTPCVSLPVISKTDGFIVTEIEIDTYQLATTPGNSAVAVYHGAGCIGANGFLQVNPPSLGLTTAPMDPGYAIPKGGSLSFLGADGTAANIDILGYKVPAKDVPGYTEVVRPPA